MERSRQLAHEQGESFAGMAEIAHAVAVNELPGHRVNAVVRAAEQFEWASHEIAAGLTWTPAAADRELAFATALVERLPLVYAYLQQGQIDRGKARVLVDYLDPANGDVTEEQSQRLCERFVPQAPGLTTKQLSERLYRALHAIDPELRRRRYQRAVQERGVTLYIDPHTGTATLVGNGLPPHEAAAAAERIDRIVEATKRAGHPGRRAQISADLYLGMLNGAFHGLTEKEIISRLLATPRPEDNPEIADETGTADEIGIGSGKDTDRWVAERVATREGIEIRVGLATLAGLDDRPGEIPGFGPVGADVARDAVAAQRRGASWKFAIVDSSGYLLLAGSLRRRPRTATLPSSVRGGLVELNLTLEEMHRYTLDPALGVWHGVLAKIAEAWANRHRLRRRLAANPHARFVCGPLADHVRIRDRNCCGRLHSLGAAQRPRPHARPRPRRRDRRGQHRPGLRASPCRQGSRLVTHPTPARAFPVGQPARAHLLDVWRAGASGSSRPATRTAPGRGDRHRGRPGTPLLQPADRGTSRHGPTPAATAETAATTGR